MQLLKKQLILLATLLLTSVLLSAQSNQQEVFTNKNVVEITKAGLSKEIIIAKISSSVCLFDVSTNALIDLKKQGVAQEVIASMLERTTTGTRTNSDNRSGAKSSKPLPLITQLNLVHYFDGNIPISLEKSLGSNRSKKNGLYGGSLLLLEIDGATSPVKLNEATADSFIVNTGSAVPDLVLCKVKTEKAKRQAIMGKLTLSGPKSGEGMLSIDVTKIGEGVFVIKPTAKLVKGEYFFTSKPSINSSTTNSDVFAFTVL